MNMKIKKIVINLIKNILPFRTAVVAVMISVIATVLVSTVSYMGRQFINSEMDAIGMNGLAVSVYTNDGQNKTDSYLLKNVMNMEDVQKATPVTVAASKAKFENNTVADIMVLGINEQAEDIVSLEVVQGRMINIGDIDKNAMVCLVDENVALSTYKRKNICGKQIVMNIGDKTGVFTVIGTIKKGSNILNNLSGDIVPDFVYIPYTTMNNFTTEYGYNQIVFTTSDTSQTVDDFYNKLSDLSYSYTSRTVKLTNLSQHKEQIASIADIAFLSLFVVSCVAVVVCSLSVASSVNTAVLTKQKDIGIKISIGASRTDITAEFLFYAILACLSGVALSMGIIFCGKLTAEYITGIKITGDSLLIVCGVSATIILTAVFSFIPSCKAAKMPPIKALNRE